MLSRNWMLAAIVVIGGALSVRVVSEVRATTPSPEEFPIESLASLELGGPKEGEQRLKLLLRDVPREGRVGDRDHLLVVSLELVDSSLKPPGRIWQTASGYHEGYYPIPRVKGALAVYPDRPDHVLIFLFFSDCTSVRVSAWEVNYVRDLPTRSTPLEDLYRSSWVPEEKLPRPTASAPSRYTVYAGCVIGSRTREVEGNVELQLEMSGDPDHPIRYLFDVRSSTLTELRGN